MRGKTPVNWIFQSPTRQGRRRRTTSPGAKPLLQLTYIRPPQRFKVGFGLKRPSMSVQNLFLARPTPKKPSPPLFSITGCRKRHKGKLLVDPGHLQEKLVGGCPHHRYIKACHCRPRVDRALQKNTRIADDHAKKLPEVSISLKWTIFMLCCPAHLFPNTPRTFLWV